MVLVRLGRGGPGRCSDRRHKTSKTMTNPTGAQRSLQRILLFIRQPSPAHATQKSMHCTMGSLIIPQAVPAHLRLQPPPAGSRHAIPASSHRPLRLGRAKAALDSTEHQDHTLNNNADARDTGNTASPATGRRVAVFKAETSRAVAVQELGRPLGELTAAWWMQTMAMMMPPH